MCIPPQSSRDADEVTVTERNGLPVDFGRVRRVITPRALHRQVLSGSRSVLQPLMTSGGPPPAFTAAGSTYTSTPDG